jgi:uncharacterized repeat protein (TIGR03803 family)
MTQTKQFQKASIKKKWFLTVMSMLALLLHQPLIHAQTYVHPNQAGQLGGNTSSAGTGSQVVTSTYYGNAGNYLGQGVIMSVNKDGTNAASFHDFDGYPGDGSYPFYTSPHQGSDGKLYGNTYVGGSWNWGSVYRYDFSNCSEFVINNNGPGDTTAGSASPGNYGNINELSDGKIYAVQTYGGKYNYGALTRMDKDGTNFEIIHSFSYSLDTDPSTPLTIDYVNYSTAAEAQTVVGVNYANYDGAHPFGFMVEGKDGKIYGSTYDGGAWSVGAFYRCNKDGSNYEIINVGYGVARTDYKDGNNLPIALSLNMGHSWGNVAQDTSGRIYIVSPDGGVYAGGGVARMNADGSNYQILHSGISTIGYAPIRGVIIIDNNVYGTYRNGSANVYGSIFKINIATSVFTTLYSFPVTLAEGGNPWAGLAYDGSKLYGTTIIGGGLGIVGTIFKINLDGTGFSTIHRFANTAAVANCGGTKGGLWTYYPSAERVTFANVNLGCNRTCIGNPAACTASNTPPVLLGTTLSNTCPSVTANLSSLLSSSTNVTWHTATPATYFNKVPNPSAAVAGTYYATFYDNVNDCYATTASAAVTVTVNPCSGVLALNTTVINLTTPKDSLKTGNTATDASPAGISPFTYQSTNCATGAASTTTQQGGMISINATTGAYTYTPPAGYTGLDAYCIKVCDASLPTASCKTVTYLVTVTPKACNATGTVPTN